MDYYLSNIKIIRIKENLYKLNLLDYGTYKKIIFNINNTITPFGIETFMGKDMMNVEFTNYNGNNDIYNIFTEINQFEKFIADIGNKQLKFNLPPGLVNQIKNKKFVSCLKISKDFDPLLRTHIRKQGSTIKTVFYKDENGNKNYVNPFSLCKKKCRFSVCAENIWTTDDSYGIIFYLNLCELL